MGIFRRKQVLIYAPFPPPHAGPEVVSEILFRDWKENPDCALFPSNVRKDNASKGMLDLSGILNVAWKLGHLFFVFLKHRPKKFYFLLSSGKVGFFRDVVLIRMARFFMSSPVAHYHGSNFRNFFQSASPRYRKFIRWGMRSVDLLLVLGHSVKKDFEGIYPNRIEVLPNPLDPRLAPLAGKFRSLESRSGKIRLLYLGHLGFAKGFYDLLVVMDRILQKRSDVELLISGDFTTNPGSQIEFLSGSVRDYYGKHFSEIGKKIRSIAENPHPSIRYFGFVTGEEKYRLYARSDIFVLPSYTEGFPLSLLEGVAFGLPSVVGRVGVLPEFFQDKNHVHFVSPGDHDGLEEKLTHLIESRPEREAMGNAARSRAESLFAAQPIQNRLKELIFG